MTMNKTEFVAVMTTYSATWAKARLRDDIVQAWYSSLAKFDAASAFEAIRRLGETLDVMPSLSVLLAETGRVERELKGLAAPSTHPDPKDYPESAYLRESKKLLYGEGVPGAKLMQTPPQYLTPEQRDVRAAIFDCARRHQVILEQGGVPNAEMLEEVRVLVAAAEAVMPTAVSEPRR
jgi:hypothetical protein